ncbi:hypothetical protein Hanom_Chr08g00702801 [Helianthus anomalus]
MYINHLTNFDMMNLFYKLYQQKYNIISVRTVGKVKINISKELERWIFSL